MTVAEHSAESLAAFDWVVKVTPYESSFGFSTDGPFFPMVATFLLSTVGLGPAYESENPLRLSANTHTWYRGFVEPELVIDLEQIRQINGSA
jgi:hypothetical protein